MAENNKDKKIEIEESVFVELQEKMAELERKNADNEAKTAGLEELVAKNVSTNDDLKIKEKRDFEPKFKTVRIKKYPIGGDDTNLGYVIGWTNKGAYEEVERGGMTLQIVNYIDLIFLGHEKTTDGKIKAEKVRLLDFMNKGIAIHCKIIDTEKRDYKVSTGEEIDVSIFDPAHGLISTGEKIDGYSAFSKIKYKLQIPGIVDPIWVDSLYCNA